MSISLSKKDILWSYFAQFFSIATGIIVLPLALRMLSTDEIGMNYLMLTIGSLVTLFDFGFSSQFGRNITYIFSGVQELKREDVLVIENDNKKINYRLLATMIHTARYVYRRLSFIVLFSMLTFGTLYIYHVTNGFNNVHNSLLIWLVYTVSVFFNIYYLYYNSLLTGKGLIMEARKAVVYSKIAYLVIAFACLYMGLGLLGLSIANLISPFVARFVSYRYFFTPELRGEISIYEISTMEIKDLFRVIWHNAKKLGLVFVGAYTINRLGIFLVGLFLPLEVVASYGLLTQLVGVISMVSSTLLSVYNPLFSKLRVENNKTKLLQVFAFTMNIYYLLFVVGSLFLIIIAPILLNMIGSNVHLPSILIVVLFCFIVFLEGNHAGFANFIVSKNSVPFVHSALIAGTVIAVGSYISLAYLPFGLLGIVLVQGLTQLAYANWKWPYVVCKEFKISFYQFIEIGFSESIVKFKYVFHDKIK